MASAKDLRAMIGDEKPTERDAAIVSEVYAVTADELQRIYESLPLPAN